MDLYISISGFSLSNSHIFSITLYDLAAFRESSFFMDFIYFLFKLFALAYSQLMNNVVIVSGEQ